MLVLGFIFGAAFSILAIALLVIGVIGLFVQGKKQIKENIGLVLGGVVLAAIMIPVFVFSYAGNQVNGFYNTVQNYETARADVDVLETKVERLGAELLTFRDQYVGLDQTLAEAVSERDTENLRVLFERYPELKASKNAQKSMTDFIRIVDDVIYKKQVANVFAEHHNKRVKRYPSKWFVPGDVPAKLERYTLEK